MSTFETHPWCWTLGVGLPVSLAFSAWQWRAAQRSWWRRWLLCFVFVFPVTPLAFAWSNGHNAGGVVVIPAAFAIFSPASFSNLSALLYIAVISLVPFGLWSLVLFLRIVITTRAWRRVPDPIVRCVSCGEPLGICLHTCSACGWTQPA